MTKQIEVTLSHNYSKLEKDHNLDTKSKMILYCTNQLGMTPKQIEPQLSAFYGKWMRPQHIRNVLSEQNKNYVIKK